MQENILREIFLEMSFAQSDHPYNFTIIGIIRETNQLRHKTTQRKKNAESNIHIIVLTGKTTLSPQAKHIKISGKHTVQISTLSSFFVSIFVSIVQA